MRVRVMIATLVTLAALAGLAGGYALQNGGGEAAAQDDGWMSPREAVILGQRLNALEARVAELEARALPPPEDGDSSIDWTANGFRVRCYWQHAPADQQHGPGATAIGSCVRLPDPSPSAAH